MADIHPDYRQLLAKAEQEASSFIRENVKSDYCYHQLNHTQEVVKASKHIGGKESLNDKEMLTTLLAAWFHDTGYYAGAEDHELRSVELFKKFAKRHKIEEDITEAVTEAILATKMPQHPEHITGKVLCDADLSNLSNNSFFEKNELLRKEYNATHDEVLSEYDWLKRTNKLLTEHKYFTKYGEENLGEGKKNNQNKVEEALKSKKRVQKKAKKLEDNIKSLNLRIKALSEFKPDRGIETMFRLTSKNHLELSNMADNKANIMISINAIILSVIVSVLIRKVGETPFLVLPTLILTSVCLVTIVFAILSLIPSITKGRFERKDIEDRNTNLLFFGNFHKMELADYEWGVKEMMRDRDYLYGSLIKDIYYLGAVLGRKYKLLRKCYTIFMFGFVIAILSFILAYSWH